MTTSLTDPTTLAVAAPRVVAVRNPVSGNTINHDTLARTLSEQFDGEAEIRTTTANDPGIGLAGTAVAGGADVVAACGGDGTVRACVEAVKGSRTALAVIPAGTGNLLAANLNLPTNPSEALHAVDDGARRHIDVGVVNGESFTVMAGTGFDALMIDGATPAAKARFGSAAYIRAALAHLRDQTITTSVEVDGEIFYSGHTTMVLVGNLGEITGGLRIFPDARPDDGRLDVAVMRIERIRDWLRVGWALLRGTAQPAELVDRTTARTVTIVSGRPRLYELDGEVRPPATELTFSVEPAALELCLPRPEVAS